MRRSHLFLLISIYLLGTNFSVAQNHFSFIVNTGNNASVSVPVAINPSINGQSLSNGDEIGVFTPDGLCVGAIVWSGENNVITVWGNNPYNDITDGIQPGEEIHYRIWRKSTNTEYNFVEKEYSMGNGLYIVDGLYILSNLNAVPRPSTPVLSDPQNNAVDLPVNLTLRWNSAAGVDTYTIHISKNSNMSSPILDQSGITGTSYSLSNLDYDTRYYWRVRAVNAAGNSDWSTIRNFTTEDLILSTNIQLQSGWNMISSRIIPLQSNIESIFSEIVDDVVLVKNGIGETYWPDLGVNHIGNWDYKSGYQVYMDTDRELQIHGTPVIASEETVALPSGWSMVAYLSESSLDPATALASLGDNLIIAKNNTGGVYWPEFEANTMGIMNPGQGYQLYLRNPTTLVYPESGAELVQSQMVKMITGDQNRSDGTYDPTGFNATLLLMSSLIEDGGEVWVFTANGERVGSGVFDSGRAVVTVWGSDEITSTGAVPGDKLSLKYHSKEENIERQLIVGSITNAITGEAISGELVYAHNGVFIVTGSEPSSADFPNQVPPVYSLAQNYPNPFNPSTTITFSLSDGGQTTLKIFNALGREVVTLVHEHLPAGYYSTTWNASGISSGLYFYILRSGDFVETRRMILTK
jgi:hypothetical protein